MVKTAMTDEELKREVKVWAYQFVAKYQHSYRRAFVGVSIEDVKQMLWIIALNAKAKYEALPNGKKIQSMRAYVKESCIRRLNNYRTRELFKYQRAIAAVAEGISEQEMIQVRKKIAIQKSDRSLPLKAIDRLRFKNVQHAMRWYAHYLTTDWQASSNSREQQSYDDVICAAADIGKILDRYFNEKEKILMLHVGMDGFEATLRRMKQPRVGNNDRYLNALTDKLCLLLEGADYMQIRPEREQAAA